MLLDLCRRVEPDMPAVFVDTGLEYPEIREFVKTRENVTWLRPEMNFRQVIEQYGYPVGSKRISADIQGGRAAKARGDMVMYGHYIEGRWERPDGSVFYWNKMGKRYLPLVDSDIKVSDKCCSVMKKAPFHKYQRETKRRPFNGIMACESEQRKANWFKNGCNAFDSRYPISSPLSFWADSDVLQYIKQYNLPYCPIYGDIVEDKDDKLKTTWADRTGCMFCMFGVQLEKEPNRFQRMAITHPKQWDYCINNLGCGKVLDLIGVPYEPKQAEKCESNDTLAGGTD